MDTLSLFMDKKAVIDIVLHSKVLTPRQRWIVVRKVKQNEMTEEELVRISDVIQREQEFVDGASPESDGEYEERLKEWYLKSQNLKRTDLAYERFENEREETVTEERNADELLKSLNQD